MCACDEGGDVGISGSEFASCCTNNMPLLYEAINAGVIFPEGFTCAEWSLEYLDMDQNGLLDQEEVVNIVAQLMEAAETSTGDLLAC